MKKTRFVEATAMQEKKKPAKKVPAYKDRQLRDRPLERWEDIPGLDGYFQVPTFGHIKRIAREQLYPYKVIRRLPEKIILPRVAKTYNKHMRDHVNEKTPKISQGSFKRD
jgi:hypothetical protein